MSTHTLKICFTSKEGRRRYLWDAPLESPQCFTLRAFYFLNVMLFPVRTGSINTSQAGIILLLVAALFFVFFEAIFIKSKACCRVFCYKHSKQVNHTINSFICYMMTILTSNWITQEKLVLFVFFVSFLSSQSIRIILMYPTQ